LLILGTNLTQDRIVRLATLVPGAVLRAVTVDTVPGGKPVNVARAARALGGRPTLVANCPGVEGGRLADCCRDEGGLAVVAVRTAGTLRTATIVLEGDGRDHRHQRARPAARRRG
jgi:fructose-1-phosphate kinase PfkB-like protein